MPKIPFDIFIGVMWGLIMCFTIQNLFTKNKRLGKKTFTYYLLSTMLTLFLLNSLEEPIRFILISTFLFVSMLLFYRSGILKALLITSIYYLIDSLGSLLALSIFLNVLHKDYVLIKENLLDRFLMYIIIAIVSFVSILVKNLPWNNLKGIFVEKLLNLEHITTFIKNKDKISISLFFLFSIVSVAFYFTWSEKPLDAESRISYAHLYSIFLFPSIFFLGYLLYKIANLRKVELKQQKEQYDELRLYTETIEVLSCNLKKHNHDFNNIIMAQRGFIDQNNWDGLKNYFFNEVVKEQESLKRNENIYLQLQNLSHPALKGLYTTKLNKALNMSLNTSLTILDKIEDFPVSAIDLSRMSGILLDNAIEAAANSDEKTLSIAIIKEENKISMIIANSFFTKPNLDDIYKEGFSTKGEGRGLGLGILEEFVQTKYKNIRLNTGIEKDVFIQELEFLC